MKKKIIAIALCAALAVGGVVAGSLAFLMDETEAVVNTFTVGDINIDLEETEGDVVSDSSGNYVHNEFKMIPGATIDKDPFATVKKGSEQCWLFVKVTEANNFDNFMTWTQDTGWTVLEENPGKTETILYRLVDSSKEVGKFTDGVLNVDVTYPVLLNNKVQVKPEVTKEQMNALNAETFPKLTFKAYAVQCEGFETPTAAWAEIQTPTV